MKIKVSFLTKQRNDAVKIVEQGLLEALHRYKDSLDITVYVFPYNGNPLYSLFQLFNVVNITRLAYIYWKSDIVHYSSFDNYFIVFNLMFKKIFNSRTLLTVYHLEKDITNSLLDHLGFYKKIFLSFDKYLAISSFTKEQLMNLGMQEKKIIVVPIGINRKISNTYDKNLKSTRYLLYVGDEYPRKNIKTLIESFNIILKRFPYLKLVKIGVVRKERDAFLINQMIYKLGLQKNVVCIRKHIDIHILSRYYSNAELLVSPSLLEGFGLPVIEAMRCRCIPLVSRIGPYLELNLPDELYVKKIKNAYEWARKIEYILGLSPLEKRRIKHIIFKISLEYTWKKCAKQVLSIYNSLGGLKQLNYG